MENYHSATFLRRGWTLIINSPEVMRFQNKALVIKVGLSALLYLWMNEYDLCFSEFIFDKQLVALTCKNTMKSLETVRGKKFGTIGMLHCIMGHSGHVGSYGSKQSESCTGLKTKKWKNRIYGEMLSKEAGSGIWNRRSLSVSWFRFSGRLCWCFYRWLAPLWDISMCWHSRC